ncbi:MAG TPA: VUT family protein [Conexibacter sp.]|nr:VUT family protein [Conexibacter sp.]
MTSSHPRSTALLACAFLLAVATANLVTAHFAARGHPEASVVTAFALVSFGFVARDRLHDAWSRHRALKLGALIAGGALIACLSTPGAGRVAWASCAAFAASETLDAIAYQLARRRSWLARCNGSNVVGALVDSSVFVAVAFPGFLVSVAAEQACAKVAGGLLMSLALVPPRTRRLVPA